MTDENLTEFLTQRVMATRETHHVQYPLESDVPQVAIILDCSQDGMTMVILPTFVQGLAHFELHFFADGERVNPDVTDHGALFDSTIDDHTNGYIELMIAKPNENV